MRRTRSPPTGPTSSSGSRESAQGGARPRRTWQALRRHRIGVGRHAAGRARGTHGAPRLKRSRQVHHPSLYRRASGTGRGGGLDRRRTHGPGAPREAQRGDGVPELRPLPASERSPQRCLRARTARRIPERGDRTRGRNAGPGRPPGTRGSLPPPDLGRRAAAGGRRPSARNPTGSPASGRAALEPRSDAPARTAVAVTETAAVVRRDDGLGHPRSGRGPDRRRPGGGAGPGPSPAGRDASRTPHPAGKHVRRQLRRQDEPASRHSGGRQRRCLPACERTGPARGAGRPTRACIPRACVPGPASEDSGGADAPFVVAMRPEVVQIGHPPAAPGFNRIGATVRRISFLGDRLEIELELEGRHRLLARGNTLFESLAREGDRVRIYWPVADTRLLIP